MTEEQIAEAIYNILDSKVSGITYASSEGECDSYSINCYPKHITFTISRIEREHSLAVCDDTNALEGVTHVWSKGSFKHSGDAGDLLRMLYNYCEIRMSIDSRIRISKSNERILEATKSTEEENAQI